MAANNLPKARGTPAQLKTDRGGASLIREPRIGIVKDSIDACRTGILKVWISGIQQSNNPEDSASWIPVRYLSPFYGYLDSYSPSDTAGDFKNNPQSYGFWATPPDIGTEVICLFVNGFINQGYYIGCIPKVEVHNMVPAVAPGSSRVVPNKTESTSYGGADILPVSEINTNNSGINDSAVFYEEPRPVHSYQAAILFQQGLIRDSTRGVISSSTYRETPSRVFGISTPGGEIYEGGFNNQTIKNAIKDEKNPKKFKVIGRTGGHSLVMDDGDIEGNNQLIRLRSAGGHQITMSDDGQTLFLMHSNGQSWIEMNSEGAIDVFSTNSFNVRTLGDLNFHADQHINMHAGKDFRIRANTIGIESETTITNRAGTDFNSSAGNKYTVYANDSVALQSKGEANLYSNGADVVIKGKNIQLNTRNPSVIAKDVEENKPKNYPDTIYSTEKGWINTPGKLQSITTRVTSHYPMPETNGTTGGVSVKSSLVAAKAAPEAPPKTQALQNAVPSSPKTPATTSTAAANANINIGTKNVLPNNTNLTLIAQQATNNSFLSNAAATANGLVGAKVSSLTQMAESGVIKPGSNIIAQRKLDAGFPESVALSNSILTGSQGAQSAQQFLNNSSAQVGAFVNTLNKSVVQLQNTGAISPNLNVTQVTGLAMATANQGIGTVTKALNGNTASLAKISNDVASGNFAGSLADKALNGMTGVASSINNAVSGTVNAVSSAIKGAANNLQSLAEQAFRGIEASFTNLKAGEPNVLGGGEPALPLGVNTKAIANIEFLYKDVREKLQIYYADKTPENKAAWDEAGQKLKQALAQIEKEQQSNVASSTGSVDASIVKGAVGGSLNAQNMQAISNKITSGAAMVATTANSGSNAIPGGVGSVVNTITNSVTGKDTSNIVNKIVSTVGTNASSLVSSAAKSANGLVQAVTGAVTNTFKNLAGNVSNIPSAVNASKASISAVGENLQKAAGGVNGQILTKVGSLASINSELKTPIIATGTFNSAAIIAKSGSLVGDAKIPAPVFAVGPKTPEEPNQQQIAIEEAGRRVQEETAKTKELILYRQKIIENYQEGKIDKAAYLRLNQQWIEKADMRLKSLQEAEAAYATLLKQESAGENAT